ncbi:MAG: PEP-CTERM sorting domain-containing protein [Pirellulales bacterium]|nr:PEP-CTERM sorting domain-containing protein [Pirellulales bacterium]
MVGQLTKPRRLGPNRAVTFVALSCAVGLSGLLLARSARAGVVVTGDVVPADPTTWTRFTGVFVGETGPGTLSITEGSAVIGGTADIGFESGATGEATVDGANSTWTNISSVTVGERGDGTLSITAGGAVSCGGASIAGSYFSKGKVTVEGADSTWNNSSWLFVGNAGNGTLSILGGGKVQSADSYIGYGFNSKGEVAVGGAGSTWENSYLSVGGSGSGTLTIANGGLVTVTTDTYVKNLGVIHFDGGTLDTGAIWAEATKLTGTGTILTHGIITDADLVLDSADDLANQSFTYDSQPGQNILVHIDIDGQAILGAGYHAAATLTIRNDVDVASKCGYIGFDSGAAGTVAVEGIGSTWTNRTNLYVGYSGCGTLLVTGGGTVSNGLGYVGYRSDSTGDVTVEGIGSTWTCLCDVVVGRYGAGTLSIAHGGMVSVGSGDDLTIDSDLSGDSFINMSTGGMLALYGDADDSLDAFLGLVEGTDAIRYWDDAIADWAGITGAMAGEDYWLRYLTEGDLAGYTMLTVGAVPGDTNHDGRVDAADAAALAASWLQQGGWDDGDFNADGWIDDLDLAILAANWRPAAGSPAVPEPGTLAMVATALALVAAMIARRRGKA